MVILFTILHNSTIDGNVHWVMELQVGFQDVAFLSSRANFSTTFLQSYGIGESLRTAVCLRIIFDCKEVYAHCKIL